MNQPDISELAKADIGIVAALPMELAPFLSRCIRVNSYREEDLVFRGGRYDDIRVAVVECGTGFARARRATQALIQTHAPRWLLSCGFSGALIPSMRVGHIVMANSIVDQHGQQLEIPLQAAGAPERGLHVGRLLTADQIIRLISEKQLLATRHNAIAVDMESLAVAQVAQELHIRFMAVRAISDDLSEDLPPEILSILAGSGATRIGAALTSLFKRPSSYKDMLHLRENARKAADNLATFLDGVVHQLHEAG